MKSSLLSGLLMLCTVMAWTTGSRARGSQQSVAVSGWFYVKWGHGTSGSTPQSTIRYFLRDDYGNSTELQLDDKSVGSSEGPLAFDRKRVRILGEQTSVSDGLIRVRSITVEKPSARLTRHDSGWALIEFSPGCCGQELQALEKAQREYGEQSAGFCFSDWVRSVRWLCLERV